MLEMLLAWPRSDKRSKLSPVSGLRHNAHADLVSLTMHRGGWDGYFVAPPRRDDRDAVVGQDKLAVGEHGGGDASQRVERNSGVVCQSADDVALGSDRAFCREDVDEAVLLRRWSRVRTLFLVLFVWFIIAGRLRCVRLLRQRFGSWKGLGEAESARLHMRQGRAARLLLLLLQLAGPWLGLGLGLALFILHLHSAKLADNRIRLFRVGQLSLELQYELQMREVRDKGSKKGDVNLMCQCTSSSL